MVHVCHHGALGMACLRRSEVNLVESVLFFHLYMGCRARTQNVRRGSECFQWLMSHFNGLSLFLFKIIVNTHPFTKWREIKKAHMSPQLERCCVAFRVTAINSCSFQSLT